MSSTVTMSLSDFDQYRTDSEELSKLRGRIKDGLKLEDLTVYETSFVNYKISIKTNSEFILEQHKQIEELKKKIRNKKWYQFIKI